MTTCSDLIRQAMRRYGELARGVEPTSEDTSHGIVLLQNLILNLPGLILNASWEEQRPTASMTAAEGERIFPATGAVVVTLPTTISEYGDTRTPRDLARVQIFSPGANEGLWVYSATKAAWSRVDALGVGDESPFGPEDDEGLACQLAVAMADEDGAQASSYVIAKATSSAAAFRARFKRPVCERPWPTDYR